MKLNVKTFSLALAIIWCLGVFISGILATLFNYGAAYVNMLSSVYIGFKATYLGSVIGAIWGFFDAWIGGAIFAALYNKLTG